MYICMHVCISKHSNSKIWKDDVIIFYLGTNFLKSSKSFTDKLISTETLVIYLNHLARLSTV